MKRMTKKQLQKIDEHVGRQLRTARNLRGYSQAAVAEYIRLSFQQVQKYENAGDRMSASRMYQVAKFLGLPPSFFFDGLPLTDLEPLPSLDHEHATLIRHYDALTKKQRKDALQIIKIMGSGHD